MIHFYSNIRLVGALSLGVVVAGCGGGFEGVGPSSGDGIPLVAIGEDRGRDSGTLADLQAGIYIDPDGCQIWMIDDGVEGYWSRRRDPRSGLPVCVPIAAPNSIVGDFRAGQGIQDWVPAQR